MVVSESQMFLVVQTGRCSKAAHEHAGGRSRLRVTCHARFMQSPVMAMLQV